jgi:hypothetical protein
MKKSDIYEIAIKILGIYLFATSVISVFSNTVSEIYFLGNSNNESENFPWATYLTIAILNNIVVPIFVSLFLLFKTNFIVKKICVPSDFEESVHLFAEPRVIYETALVITGLLLIIWEIPDLSSKLKFFLEEVKSETGHNFNEVKYIWLSVIKILVGMFVLLLSRQIAGFFGKRVGN